MFDFFVKNRLSPQELAAFIAVTLGCPAENVLAVTSSELQGIPPVELNTLRCLCLYWHVTGDAALLVSLYRVEASPEEIQEKVVAASRAAGVVCYVPNDNFNGYLLCGEAEPVQVYEDEAASSDEGLHHISAGEGVSVCWCNVRASLPTGNSGVPRSSLLPPPDNCVPAPEGDLMNTSRHAELTVKTARIHAV